MNTAELVVEVVAAAGGEIVGRVRLQKIIFLLKKLGLDTNAKFSYHHYGPFSRGVDEAISVAKANHSIRETVERRASDGVPYSVFKITERFDCMQAIDWKSEAGSSLSELVREMATVPSTVLEIASTIEWLVEEERVPDWLDELRRRKGMKAEGGRIELAEKLLDRLGLGVIHAEVI